MENFQCHRLLYILALKMNKLLLLFMQVATGFLISNTKETRKLHLQANVTKKVIILHNPSYRL